jgi:hypothetical protein
MDNIGGSTQREKREFLGAAFFQVEIYQRRG